jgi:hypothetical protein
MPPRTNTFQAIVAILHRHLMGDAAVEESALLENRLTHERREVDVVIRTEVPVGYPVVISVEATRRRRKATVEWVEQLVEKHRFLPTDKLILVSSGGFSAAARATAEANGALPLSPEDLVDEKAEARIVGRLRSLWPKLLALTPETFVVHVERPDGSSVHFRGLPDHLLYVDPDTPVATLNGFAHLFIQKRFSEVAEQLGMREVSEDMDARFRLESDGPHASGEGSERRELLVRWEEVEPPEYHRVTRLVIEGKAHIEVREMPLRHMRLGSVEFSQGQTDFGGHAWVVVVTEGEGGGQLTMRAITRRAHGEA